MRFLWSCVVNLWLLFWWPLRALRARSASPRGGYLALKLDGGVVEIAARRRFWQRGPRVVSVHALREALEVAARDPRVRGLVLSFRHAALGAAVATSLRDVLQAWRTSGKLLIAYLPLGAGNRELYVASVADRVFLGHETWVLPLGFSVDSPYLKSTLDRIGVEPDVYSRREYKTAMEFVTRSEMSEPQREQLGALLDDAYERLIDALAKGRGVDTDRAREWVDGAPYDADDAARVGLVDGVVDDDALLKILASETLELPSGSDAGNARLTSVAGYARRRRLAFRPFLRRPYIAVVEMRGAIVGKSPGAPQLGEFVVDDDFREILEEVGDDPKALGVVVHIDSRGGSALASDRILRAVRKLGVGKPVVAYMGNIAASGGYMIALGGQEVIAQPSTITGSIGVVAARLIVERLASRLGVSLQRESRGAHAGMLSPFRPFSESERARFESLIDAGYRRFVGSVAEARGKAFDETEAIARGRVWSATAAKERGLVDTLGGLDRAIESVRQRVGPKAGRAEVLAVAPVHIPSPLTLAMGGAHSAFRSRLLERLAPEVERQVVLLGLGLMSRGLPDARPEFPELLLWCDAQGPWD
ncbi:MAG: signal peptide peptidase SppA [Polyangiaceae bacterium]|nr:signal peptide peptidase SppA [Myxococcales bacterium]MCB9584789.1 signal peptide peptidase SppA [Polyangiaceae bacterium]MCB9607638.1 signal peptide peptidase SppA [Polyangiaceae bacterium]